VSAWREPLGGLIGGSIKPREHGLPRSEIAGLGMEVTMNEIDDSNALMVDVAAYCAQLDDLLAKYEGKYVVFANASLVKVCENLESALALGYREFGSAPFMVQRVEPLRAQVDFHLACRA
jgi:hypothetical protein